MELGAAEEPPEETGAQRWWAPLPRSRSGPRRLWKWVTSLTSSKHPAGRGFDLLVAGGQAARTAPGTHGRDRGHERLGTFAPPPSCLPTALQFPEASVACVPLCITQPEAFTRPRLLKTSPGLRPPRVGRSEVRSHRIMGGHWRSCSGSRSPEVGGAKCPVGSPPKKNRTKL